MESSNTIISWVSFYSLRKILLLTESSSKAGIITRTFDELNRSRTRTNGNLKELTYPNGQTITYNYDGSCLLTDTIDFNGGTTHYDYDNNGRIKIIMSYGKGNRLLTYNGQEVKYDTDGKMVDFKYDARNRLIEAGNITYQYNAENNRIGQITNGEKTTYVVDTTSSALSRVLLEKKGDTVRQYIYGLGLIMEVEGN